MFYYPIKVKNREKGLPFKSNKPTKSIFGLIFGIELLYLSSLNFRTKTFNPNG
jgi:hypothetical protein